MFKRLFSCFGEGTMGADLAAQQDLSGQQDGSQAPLPLQAKPTLHPESNIQGKNINFEIEDFGSSELHQHFLQSAAFNSDGLQKKVLYYNLTPILELAQ